MSIKIFGMGRSGGTLTWKLLNDLLKGGVGVQTHSYFGPEDIIAVVTYRDFRDCVLSIWRGEYGKFIETDKKNLISLKKLKELNYVETIQHHVGFLNRFKDEWDQKKVIYLKYENFYNDYDYIISNVGNKVPEINTLSDDFKEQIKNKWSRENVIEIQKQFNSFGEHKEHIHGFHVGTAKPGSWKQYLNEEDHEEMSKIFNDDLLKWRYEI